MIVQKLILKDLIYKNIVKVDDHMSRQYEAGELDVAPITARMSDADFATDNAPLLIRKGGSVSFDTFTNSLSCGKWKKYTILEGFTFSMAYTGIGTLKLMHAYIDKSKKVEAREIASADLNSFEPSMISVTIGSLERAGIIYPVIEARADIKIYEAFYECEDTEPTQPVKLAIDICTFKREQYVKRNVGILKNDILNNPNSPLYGKLWIHISDNAGTLDGIVDSEPNITVDKNANFGGVGGFTRGIIETQNIADKEGFTHVLLMDDDATISSSAVEINYIFLSYLKPKYFDYTIGGKLLVLGKPYKLFEAGAQWNRGDIVALKNGFDIREVEAVLEAEVEDDYVEYAGWWYCCIPLKEIGNDNYPLPIFIHRDDIEYGLRVGKDKFIFLNSICIWHESFAGKLPGMLDYYDIRNEAIVNSIVYEDYSKREFKKLVKRFMLSNIARYRYKYIDYNIKAVEDFLKGIDFIHETDALKLHQELLSMNYKAKPAIEYEGERGLTKEQLTDIYEGEDFKLPLIHRLFNMATLNGLFFPAKKNYTLVCSPYESVYNLFRVSDCIFVDINQNGVHTTRSRSEFFRCRKIIKRAMKMIDKDFNAARDSYHNRYKEIISREFWDKYLGL